MLSSYLPLMGLVLLIVMLRPLCWWASRMVTMLYHKAAVWLLKAKQRDEVAGLWSQLKVRYPKMSQIVQARLTTSHFSGLLLTLIIVVMLYLLALFAGLVEELLEAEELIHIDYWINEQLTLIRTDSTLMAFAWLTDLGGAPALIAVAVVATGIFWAHHMSGFITPLWLTVLGSQLMTYTGKFLLQRPRPESVTDLVEITPSFPSGHATSALAFYGFMAYIISRGLSSARQRFELIYWAAMLILLIGGSRLVLSVHYASDVVAGFLVGSFWLLMGMAVAELIHRKWQHQSSGER